MEQTLLIVKPNAITHTEDILEKVKQEGFAVRQVKTLSLTLEEAEDFYAVHRGKPFFADLVKFMSSGKIVAVLLERENAVRHLRKIVGATDPNEAEEGTLRRIYGSSKTENAVHASDSLATAESEIAFFFGEEEVSKKEHRGSPGSLEQKMNYLILEKKQLAPGIKQVVLNAPEIAKKAKPGQFVIVRCGEKGERIPLTVVEQDEKEGTLTIIFQEVGRSTRKLGSLEEGEEITDVVGPLGNPSEIRNFGTVVCIGGGVGTAVIYPIAKALKAAGNRLVSIIGAKNKQSLILEEQMRKVSDRLVVTTDDGSYGIHGFVTDALEKLVEDGLNIARVVAAGPVVMMNAISHITEKENIQTIVSLNPIMVDGTGMCGACRVTVAGKTRFACIDGPEFDGHQVDFEELLRRQQMYLQEEKQALEKGK